MPLNRAHVFSDAEIPTAANINAEFNNICSKFSSNITAGDLDPSAIAISERYINAALYSTIREAVDAAYAAGLDVWVPEGTYDSDSEPINVPPGVNIDGAGSDKVTITPPASYAFNYLFSVSSNSRISGITITEPSSYDAILTSFAMIAISSGTTSTSAQANVRIDRVRFDLDSGLAINERAGVNCIGVLAGLSVTNCTFAMTDAGATAYGIVFDSLYTALINGCAFTDGDTAIKQRTTVPSAGEIRIADCVFSSIASTVIEVACAMQIDSCLFYISSTTAISTYGYTCTVINSLFDGSGHVTNGVIAIQDTRLLLVGCRFNSTTLIMYNRSQGTYRAIGSTFASAVLDSSPTYDNVYGKYYNSNRLLRLGDVFVWIYYHTTSSKNRLAFKQASLPTSKSDHHAYAELTSSVTGFIL